MKGRQKRKNWSIPCIMLLFAVFLSIDGVHARFVDELTARASDSGHPAQVVENVEPREASLYKKGASGPKKQLSAAGDEEKTKGLTAFFLIGFVINIILLSSFLFWAAGQLRKKK